MTGLRKVARLARRRDVPGLARVLERERSEEVRRAAARALGRTGDPAAVPVLLETMGTDVCAVALEAAQAVELLGSRQASVEDLTLTLTRSRSCHGGYSPRAARRRAYNLHEVDRHGRGPIEVECDCAARDDFFAAVTRMVERRVDGTHVERFGLWLSWPEADVRRFAVRVLRAIGPAATPVLLDALPLVLRADRQPQWRGGGGEVYLRVIEALAAIGTPAAVDGLVLHLEEFAPREKYREVLDTLVRADPPGLAERLAPILARTYPAGRREWLDTALRDLSRPDLADLAGAAAEAGARREDFERALAFPDMAKLGRYVDDGEFAAEARQALRSLPDSDIVYFGLLKLLDGDHWEFAAAELGRRGYRDAVFVLIGHLRAGKEAIRPVLAGLGVAEVEGFLTSALDSADTRTRAVRLVDPVLARDHLLRLAEDHDVPYHIRYLAAARTGSPPPGSPRTLSANLLRSALAELGIGRDLGPTPYQIGTAVDATLPQPYSISTDRPDRLFQHQELERDDTGMSWHQWYTVGYHWDVRHPSRYNGTFFQASVRADGVVEFARRWPADIDGWRSVVAEFSDFGPGLHILLWRD